MPKNKRESESSQNELPTSHLLYRKANFVINEASFAFKNLLYSLKLENKKFSSGFQDLQLLLRYHWWIFYSINHSCPGISSFQWSNQWNLTLLTLMLFKNGQKVIADPRKHFWVKDPKIFQIVLFFCCSCTQKFLRGRGVQKFFRLIDLLFSYHVQKIREKCHFFPFFFHFKPLCWKK